MVHDFVIHVNRNDREDIRYALGCIWNYSAMVPGGECRIAVVANGDAVRYFRREDPEFAEEIRTLCGQPGVSFLLCRHAMANQGMNGYDAVEGCRCVPAGIVELARLQHDGYVYMKP